MENETFTSSHSLTKSTSPKAVTEDHLFGLNCAKTAVTGYLRDFILSCLYVDSPCDNEVQHGILLYGLSGCGKRSLLRALSNYDLAIDEHHLGRDNMIFLTIPHSLVSELFTRKKSNSENPFYSWIENKLTTETTTTFHAVPVVLLLPNLDSWAIGGASIADDEATQSEDAYGSKSISSPISTAFRQLLDAVNMLNKHHDRAMRPQRFGVVATAITMDDLFDLAECRQLFHRRVLVTLPDAHTRYLILRHFIFSRLAVMFPSSYQEGDDDRSMNLILDTPEVKDCLVGVASKLHGYTPKDLHRLVQIGCSSLLSRLLQSTVVPGNHCIKLPTLNSGHIVNLCEILLLESLSYLQINLSQHISPISPLRWDDIGGYDDLKNLFRGVIEKRLTHAVQPDSFDAQADAALGLRVPRGVLLHGPPGLFTFYLITVCELIHLCFC
ncbi:unnamed protein product [Echinostoma caproni]|uniref:Dynein light intermediate chain n=1 Tax=Echinostoma caproni TaxID=27848 RepID=A0A183A068_9TREM|nr:unnamed protein product [Echinostoma caproni]